MPGAAWLVLPTYDEAENVEAIVRAADAVLGGCAPEDTASSSSTTTPPTARAQIADRLAAERRRWRCCTGPCARGWGRRTWRGSRMRSGAAPGYVLEMDADFSHDPADLARLLAAVRGERRPGARLALRRRRRRRATGVSCAGIISRGGSSYARRVLGLPRARPHRRLQVLPRRGPARRSTCRRCARTDTRSRWSSPTAPCAPASSVVEVPITFRDRLHGRSKMSARIAARGDVAGPALRGWSPGSGADGAQAAPPSGRW